MKSKRKLKNVSNEEKLMMNATRAQCSVNYEAICMKIAIFVLLFSFVICSSVEVEWLCLCFFFSYTSVSVYY